MCLHYHCCRPWCPACSLPASWHRAHHTVFYEDSESLQSNIAIAHHVCLAQKCQFRLTDAQKAQQVGLQTQHVRQLRTAAQDRRIGWDIPPTKRLDLSASRIRTRRAPLSRVLNALRRTAADGGISSLRPQSARGQPNQRNVVTAEAEINSSCSSSQSRGRCSTLPAAPCGTAYILLYQAESVLERPLSARAFTAPTAALLLALAERAAGTRARRCCSRVLRLWFAVRCQHVKECTALWQFPLRCQLCRAAKGGV